MCAFGLKSLDMILEIIIFRQKIFKNAIFWSIDNFKQAWNCLNKEASIFA
jgi:hypothetical protein